MALSTSAFSSFSILIPGIAWLFLGYLWYLSALWLSMQTSVLGRLWSKWQLLPWSQSARLDDIDAHTFISHLPDCMFDHVWQWLIMLDNAVRFCLILLDCLKQCSLLSLLLHHLTSTSKALDSVAYETVSLCLALRWHLQRATKVKQSLKQPAGPITVPGVFIKMIVSPKRNQNFFIKKSWFGFMSFSLAFFAALWSGYLQRRFIA